MNGRSPNCGDISPQPAGWPARWHEIRGGQPGALVGVEAERALREIEIYRDEGVAQPP